MLSRLSLVRVIVAVVSIVSTRAAAQQLQSSPARTATTIDRANLDTTCAACSDFWEFANGGWLQRTIIPAQYPQWSSFWEVAVRNEAVLHKILEAAAADVKSGNATAPSERFKIGAYVTACMDTATIEALGTRPIDAAMAKIAAIRTSADLPATLAALDRSNHLAPFNVGVGPDNKNSDRTMVFVGQGGAISLPGGRNSYLSRDSSMQRIRDAYERRVAAMFELYGERDSAATADAKTVLAIETKFAGAMMDNVVMRDPDATYHPMTMAQFDSIAPRMNWGAFIVAQGGPADVAIIDVRMPDFFKAMDGFLTSIPVEDWRTLLRWRVLHRSAAWLPKRFADEDFAFQRLFSGQPEPLPRWERCAMETDEALGEAVGQEYVARTFSPAAKARAIALVDNMVSVLRDQVGQLDWMSDSTKAQAIIKLNALSREIGYPNKWRDYSTLDIRVGEYDDNFERVGAWLRQRNWAKLGKPIDRTQWTMTPSTVNATYSPVANQIVVPAAILQPPFYDPNADDAVNYGAIGMVIAHEMTHGFDDEGRRYDAKGNVRDWWTKADAERYTTQAQRVIDQFNAYTIVDSTTHVNGRRTVGENIADLGGVKIAYLALEKSLAAHGRPGLIDGFTPEQRFFLSYAQAFRSATRDDNAKARIYTDTHSPDKWRINGPLSNMPEFKAAWGCKDGDAMVRADSVRARIW